MRVAVSMIVLALLFMLFGSTIVQANNLEISYTVHENHNACGGKSKYLVEIRVYNPTDEYITGLIHTYVFKDKEIYTHCEPKDLVNGFYVKPHETSVYRYYYTDLPKSGSLLVSLSIGSKKEKYVLPFSLPLTPATTLTTVTTATTLQLQNVERSTNIFQKVSQELNYYLLTVYNSLGLRKYIQYDHFLYALTTVLVLAVGSVVVAYQKRKKAYRFYIDRYEEAFSEYSRPYKISSLKLFAKCEKCEKWVYLPFRCNYCGNYFCGDHILPPNHNCPNIDEWRRKRPPEGGIYRYRFKKGL